MLTMAAVLLPPIAKLVNQKWKVHISGKIKLAVVIIGFIIFGATIDTSNTTVSQQIPINQKQEESKDNKNIPGVEKNSINNSDKNESQPKTIPSLSEDKPAANSTETESKPAAAEIITPSETVSQKNAVAKAKSYLGYSAFSRDGLVAQLEYEQFSHADAIYGADNSGANWNEQAAKKAKSYLEYSAFSRGSLIQQLKFEKFTQAQAEYGATAVGL